MGSATVDLHKKGVLICELLIVSGNWLTLGGTVLPGSIKPQMSKHQKYRKYKT